MKARFYLLSLLCAILIGFSSFHAPLGDPVRDNPLALGNPSSASSDKSNKYNYLLEKGGYALSFNDSLGYPNWVAWHLNSAWRGDVKRYKGKFQVDDALPSGFLKLSHDDYTNSGFDRGHICPSADRTFSKEENKETFFMSNIYPQSPNLNQQTWRLFEEYCQKDLADKGFECYLLAGGYGTGGVAKDGQLKMSIASGKVNVPSHCWKVVLVLPDGVNDFSRIDTSARIIAVWMPNTQQVKKHKWWHYRVAVDEIEKMTGLDFFSALPDDIEDVIEAKPDAISFK